MCFRETLIAVLAPVRNFSVVCFEGVTPNSVCESEPVRNGLREIKQSIRVSVRNERTVCFEGVTSISECAAVSVRNGAHGWTATVAH